MDALKVLEALLGSKRAVIRHMFQSLQSDSPIKHRSDGGPDGSLGFAFFWQVFGEDMEALAEYLREEELIELYLLLEPCFIGQSDALSTTMAMILRPGDEDGLYARWQQEVAQTAMDENDARTLHAALIKAELASPWDFSSDDDEELVEQD